MTEFVKSILEQYVASGSSLIYVFIFLGGVLASFTPCTYPVLPLTVGYIGNTSSGDKKKAFLLSLFMVIGMALVYAVVGVAVKATGSFLGSIWSNGWAVFAIAWFFIIMALMLLEAITFPVPKFMSQLQAGGKRKGYLGAFLTGGVSGLVVGPCTGPIIGVVLGLVLTVPDAEGMNFALQALSGGFKLFLFGLGQGTLILICGTFTGMLSYLPKSGQWLVTVKKAFAMIILFGASLLFVHVGQKGSNFPQLIQLLSNLDRAEAPATPKAETAPVKRDANGNKVLEGDNFLD